VTRRLIPGSAPLEPVVGYSRAVVAGRHVYVSGTAPIPLDGSDPPEGSYAQARLCLEIVRGALAEAGARVEDVVRTRIFLTPEADFEQVARAHGELFGEIRPATSGVVVHSLLDPRWLVEIEADAVMGPAQTPASPPLHAKS
jgi:enamine deaminase RidA (YjgF/YER057c/UK114 family)